MKIQIIGYSGSGKSTLAKILSDYYHIPLLYMDNVQFYGDWQERSQQQQNHIVEEFLNTHEDWVIDGNYGHVAPQRFQQCDMIIFLNYSRWYCFFMCLKRYFKYRGSHRESCPCDEKFDLEFIRWILIDGRTKQYQKKHYEHFRQCSRQRLMFKNRKQLIQYLKDEGIQLL